MPLKYLIVLFTWCIFVVPAVARNLDSLKNDPNFKTTEEIIAMAHNEKSTDCSSRIFSDALRERSDEINDSMDEFKVRAWARNIMQSPDIIQRIFKCPEFQSVNETTTINFTPVIFEFPSGNRTITINYSTQPKVLKQKLMLASKPSLPDGNPNPDLFDEKNPAKYINTDPAWYAIMVVQHDSLKDFVGPDKNNTLSMKYLEENVDSFYPKGYMCTSKSALAPDSDTINQVVRKVVDLEKDSNDYYVAGDVNLEWIMYAEIAAEIAITVLTWGAGEAAIWGMKGARATKDAKNISTTLRTLSKADDVKDYMKFAKNVDNAADLAKAEKIAKESKNVQKYLEAAKTFEELMKYRRALRAFKRPQTGNILAKAFKGIKNTGKTLKAVRGGEEILAKSAKVARGGMSSLTSKIGHRLFDNTLKYGAKFMRVARDGALIYGALNLIGEMYDKTSTTSTEFSNGIEFKPLCLLSADDLEGQENVVNYGMWLMWEGNSTDPADDDAAYLQASDFAEKFAYELEEFQEKISTIDWCNVDIYVVHPIIRIDETNPDDTKGELFYLFMNDVPWSSSDQFKSAITDISAWEQQQQNLTAEDSRCKYKTKEECSKESQSQDTTAPGTTEINEDQNQTVTNAIDEVAPSVQTGNIYASTYKNNPENQQTSTDDTFCHTHTNNDSNIYRKSNDCNKLSGTEQSRCKKCVAHAGTYENGRCYIEILHWVCREKGWDENETRSCNQNHQYKNCGLIRRYADAEQPFTCPKDGILSGCCQHGNSSGAKHPPFNIEGGKFTHMNCKVPLSSNVDWRVAYDNGSAIGIKGLSKSTRSWCMPSEKSHPWNDENQSGGAKHCAKTISGGTSLDYWHSLN